MKSTAPSLNFIVADVLIVISSALSRGSLIVGVSVLRFTEPPGPVPTFRPMERILCRRQAWHASAVSAMQALPG